ncbi:MAG: class I SAM-dependent methyltransferase [Thermoleophilia bacterium]|nr:class I SAM-dependent methyltransferase [Thermoleophilia bacterium]
MRLDEVWDAQAEEWTRFVRDPHADRTNRLFNLPRFLDLLPPPPRRALDLGCGEGRLGAELRRRGDAVVGVDSSPGMVAAAEDRIDAVVADAAALPFADATFDLVAAFMSLQDMDDLDGAVAEAARVLEHGGRLCFNVLHPIAEAGRFDSREPDSPFTVRGSYYECARVDDLLERDGFRLSLSRLRRPLEAYARALEAAGFLIEALREPAPPAEWLALAPSTYRWDRIPLFLHVSAVRL